MYTKWEDIKEEAYRESGLSEAQVKEIYKRIAHSIAHFENYKTDVFLMGSFRFKVAKVREWALKKKDILSLQRERGMLNLMIGYYAEKKTYRVPPIVQEIADKFNVTLPPRGEWNLSKSRQVFADKLGIGRGISDGLYKR